MNPYSFTKFLVEAEKLKKSNGLSEYKIIKRLAPKYNIKESALKTRWWRYKNSKMKSKNSRPNIVARKKQTRKQGKRILTMEEEASLVTLLKVTGRTNCALRKSDIIDYVRKNFMKNKVSFRGDRFIKKFLKRNSDLKLGNLKVISSHRVNESSVESCEEFINVMEDTVKNFNFQAETTLNVDEFQLKISGYTCGRKRITAFKNKQVASKNRGACIGSLIAFISADGALRYSALCLKPDSQSRVPGLAYIDVDLGEIRNINTRERPIPQLRLYSESGMIDKVCWSLIWQGFLDYISDVSPGLQHIVFMDNLQSHIQLDCIEKGINNNVEVRLLPKGTSQFSQPADSFVFGLLRKQMNKATSSEMIKNPNETLNHMIRDMVPEAMQTAFKPTVIKASFKATGLFPYDSEIIRKNCRENLGLLSEEDNLDPLKELEEKVEKHISGIFEEPKVKKAERKRVPVQLRQAYTSGHVVQQSEDMEKKKRYLEQIKIEKKKAADEKKKSQLIKKEALAEKKKAAEEKKKSQQNKKEALAEKRKQNESAKTSNEKIQKINKVKELRNFRKLKEETSPE